MKKCISFLVVLVAICSLAGSVLAAGFEGVIKMEVTTPMSADKKIPMTVSIKDKKSLVEMEAPQVGKMMIFTDQSTHKATMVMTAMKMGFSMDIDAAKEMVKDHKMGAPVATGQKKTINGHSCELYTMDNNGDGTIEMWMTSDIPKDIAQALHESMSGMQGGMNKGKNVNSEAFMALAEKGLFPCETIVKDKSGKQQAQMDLLSFEKKSLSDDLFTVPSDIKIQPMPTGMGGGMGHH